MDDDPEGQLVRAGNLTARIVGSESSETCEQGSGCSPAGSTSRCGTTTGTRSLARSTITALRPAQTSSISASPCVICRALWTSGGPERSWVPPVATSPSRWMALPVHRSATTRSASTSTTRCARAWCCTTWPERRWVQIEGVTAPAHRTRSTRTASRPACSRPSTGWTGVPWGPRELHVRRRPLRDAGPPQLDRRELQDLWHTVPAGIPDRYSAARPSRRR